MKKITVLVVIISLILSSCASVLRSKNQNVSIDTKRSDVVYINGEKVRAKNGQYMLERDMIPKQITIKSENYHDKNVVVFQHRKSPLSFVSILFLFYPFILDTGPKAFDYDKEISIPSKKYPKVGKVSDMKNLRVNKVGVDIESGKRKYREFKSYKDFLRKENKKKAEVDNDEEDVKIENSIFSLALNDLLKDLDFVDTTGKVLNISYLDNLYIDADIMEYTLHHVRHKKREVMDVSSNFVSSYAGMVFVDLIIRFDILDIYKEKIFSHETKTRSGQFPIFDYEDTDEVIQQTIKDAMEIGLIELLNDKKIVEMLRDRSEADKEKEFPEIVLKKSDEFVSNLSEAVNSSLTIKTKDKMGSGFMISKDGYVITNYHVVTDTSGLHVIDNKGVKYNATLIRVSKISDLALLKTDITGFKPFEINISDNFPIGNDVYAIGTPTAEDLSQTVSRGIISGIRPLPYDARLIQTDASINYGNSGGALTNKNGEVLGVVNAKLSGYSIEGVSFAIPSYEIFNRLKIRFE